MGSSSTTTNTSITKRLSPIIGLMALALGTLWFNNRVLIMPIEHRRTDTADAITYPNNNYHQQSTTTTTTPDLEEDEEIPDNIRIQQVEDNKTVVIEEEAAGDGEAGNDTSAQLQQLPKLVWLMSFPNSGTSYTMTNVQTTSQRTVATNYDQEINLEKAVHLYSDDSNSPYLLEPNLPLPRKLILTKTHCSGHCERCVPITDPQAFEIGCRSLGTGKNKTNYYSDREHVSKAVHLFRNPFDNLVARMHLGIKRRKRTKRRMWSAAGGNKLKDFDDTSNGVKAWCRHADKIFKANMDNLMKQRNIAPSIHKNLPCHTDWFRYVEWHNRAIEVLERLRIPVHVLYYENYTTKYNETVREVLDFLELDAVRDTLPFVPGKVYDDVYDNRTRRLAAKFVKAIATEECWKYLRHYMEPYLNLPGGDLALLISYPNSGTSYTIANTIALTNHTTATNHGQEVAKLKNQTRIPILGFDSNHEMIPSPFVLRPHLDVPHIALTKSHCGGFCFECYPSYDAKYFDQSCRTVSWNDETTGKFKSSVYSADLVKKVVHLIRNPYDNIVSRMHHAIHHQQQLSYSDKLLDKLTDPNPRKNLRVWCNYIDKKFTSYVPSSIKDRHDSSRLLSIPCHADFIRYVYWHNSAFDTTKSLLGVPVYTLYYENYTTNYDETIRELYQDFLGQGIVSSPHPFDSSGKNYRDDTTMFDKQHSADIAYLVQSLSSGETWDYLRHYFTTPTTTTTTNIRVSTEDNMMPPLISLAAADEAYNNDDNNDGDKLTTKHPEAMATTSSYSATTTTAAAAPNNKKGESLSSQPQVAWLLSFPESGTALLMNSIQKLTNTTAATNYGLEVINNKQNRDGTVLSVRPEILGSPYLLNPDKNVPSYVLTKTHCIGYCGSCSSHEFVYSVDSFENGCRRSIQGDNSDEPTEYPASLVQKVVHLIRNPFDNLVARSKVGVAEQRDNNDAATSSEKESLRGWCQYIDTEFEKAEKGLSYSPLDETTRAQFRGIPCASELYRYIVWHNTAIKMMKEKLPGVPVQYIYYEDYVSSYSQTTRYLVKFLGLDMIESPPAVHLSQAEQQSSYADLFDASEAVAIAKFLHTFASPEAWQHMHRYLSKWIPDVDEPRPRIAWLMSFPNSGTSYTLENTVSLTNMSVATNYAEEAVTESNLTVPLRPDLLPMHSNLLDSVATGATPGGPYILRPSLQTPPITLTKTHCSPKHNLRKFEKGCRTALIYNPHSGEAMKLRYPSWLVDRVIHLFRSPFDNIVARMHLGIRKRRRKGSLTEKTLSEFTETKKGLHLWCKFLDDSFGKLTESWVPSSHKGLLKKIPCYSDLLHYVMWHENAIKVYEKQYKVPYHILYYEDYADRYNETVNELYKFLDMPVVGKPTDFKTGKTYKHLFEEDEISAMARVIHASASPGCWDLLSRYFVDGTITSQLPTLIDTAHNETSSGLTRESRR